MKSDQPEGRRRGIQSVEIGLRILKSLAGLGMASPLGAIAQACDMPTPQVHRYLQSLIAEGMVQQLADSGRYDLGPAALSLGLSTLARVDAFKLADAALGDFSQRTGLTIQMAALGPQGPTIVRWIMGRPPVMTSFNVGTVLPLLGSATGRIFFAFMPAAETEALIAQDLATGHFDALDLTALKAQICRQGYAHVDGNMVPGLQATAYPIFDLQGRIPLTVTVLQAFRGKRKTHCAIDELGDLCGRLSRELGWTPQA
ncbi:IclR family transcriptional regulator [Novosphingobium profundi]|uniref:IclR family transcriptional regulator n=1 Tax=Novosphingobium profundi TaxID=1774954 RepID=UPI001BD92AC7|nr:IclR family transcriptional regulator [Novosphingobium profundi]MBT0667314.1 IclR family transcriptional regulator [Novosphingobium profundi]